MERRRHLPSWVGLVLAALLGAGVTWALLASRPDGGPIPGAGGDVDALQTRVAQLERDLEEAQNAPRPLEGLAAPPSPTEDERRVALERDLAETKRRLEEAIAQRDIARTQPRVLRVFPALPGAEGEAALVGGPGVTSGGLGPIAPVDLPEVGRLQRSPREEDRRAAYAMLARASNAEALSLLQEALATNDAGPLVPALMQRAAALKDRAWSAAQATGAPDTPIAEDNPTAWASKQGDMGEVTIDLDYETAVRVDEVRVRETYNPGAVVRILALEPGGGWDLLWEGVAVVEGAPRWFAPPVRRTSYAVRRIRIVLDTDRVGGWNEIDAVELVGDGRRQWATTAQASSSYAD
jgi:hypothetical protein